MHCFGKNNSCFHNYPSPQQDRSDIHLKLWGFSHTMNCNEWTFWKDWMHREAINWLFWQKTKMMIFLRAVTIARRGFYSGTQIRLLLIYSSWWSQHWPQLGPSTSQACWHLSWLCCWCSPAGLSAVSWKTLLRMFCIDSSKRRGARCRFASKQRPPMNWIPRGPETTIEALRMPRGPNNETPLFISTLGCSSYFSLTPLAECVGINL